MLEIQKDQDKPFNLNRELERISAKAALYSNRGNLDIWIYFAMNRCHCSIIELSVLENLFIAHYKCEKLLSGLSKAEWKKLERKIVAASKKGDS